MKGQVASVLIVLALLLGIGLGYFWNSTQIRTTTQAVFTTYATTVPGVPPGEGLPQCTLAQYTVYN